MENVRFEVNAKYFETYVCKTLQVTVHYNISFENKSNKSDDVILSEIKNIVKNSTEKAWDAYSKKTSPGDYVIKNVERELLEINFTINRAIENDLDVSVRKLDSYFNLTDESAKIIKEQAQKDAEAAKNNQKIERKCDRTTDEKVEVSSNSNSNEKSNKNNNNGIFIFGFVALLVIIIIVIFIAKKNKKSL